MRKYNFYLILKFQSKFLFVNFLIYNRFTKLILFVQFILKMADFFTFILF